MSVKEKPKTFVASDDSEFETKKEAERHDALVMAIRDYEQAQKQLSLAMSATIKTADGELFDVRRWGNYWFVSDFGLNGPSLIEVTVGYGTNIRLDDYRNGSKVEIVIEHNRDRGNVSYSHYDIDALYSTRENADKALAEAIKTHIATKKKELAKLTNPRSEP